MMADVSGSNRMTQRTTVPAHEVLAAVTDDRRRSDATCALELLQSITDSEAIVWGTSIIGFGRQPYTTADGMEHEWFALGFAARKAALTFYGLTYDHSNDDLLAALGPHTTGKGCLYVKRLGDVDLDVLRHLVRRAWEHDHDAE